MTRRDSSPASHALACTLTLLLLVALRAPSLVEPIGADQALYAYVGQRITAGDVTYRDAWDQKPPAIHFIYAGLWRLWPHESVVPAADLAAAAGVAWLLLVLGRRTMGAGTGMAAASIFLLLGNPAIQRLSGVRVRAQCETFIALAIVAAMVLATTRARRAWPLLLAGICLGLAFWLKYNAITYVVPVVLAGMFDGKSLWKTAVWVGVGFAVIGAVFVSYFAAHGALRDLWLATISYNLRYSGETYRGASGVIGYLTFPLHRAKVDLLWYLGGLGIVVLLLFRRLSAATWIAVGWVAAACLSIAINGARDLPQYFVQAHPALALAGAAGVVPLFERDTRAIARWLLAAVLLVGLWRVGDEPVAVKLGGLDEVRRNAAFDLQYARGKIDRTSYLSRFQEQADTKYVPLSTEQLTERVRAISAPGDRILVFGLAAGVYVNAPRESASRFFWSRPVVTEFGQGLDDYGSAGLLRDLRRHSPVVVALQKHWDTPSPRDFFMTTPALRDWLEAGYVLDQDTPEFVVWRRRS